MRRVAILAAAGLSLLVAAGCLYTAHIEISDRKFSPKVSIETDQCDSASWKNTGTTNHTATSAFFDTGQIAPAATTSPLPFPNAGKFPYHDADHRRAKGIVEVPIIVNPPSAARNDTIDVTWSGDIAPPPCGAPANPAGTTFDVQVRTPGSKHFRFWQRHVVIENANYTVRRKGTYVFRARVNFPNAKSGWSPSDSARVS